jgi:type VI secretion system protein VasG
MTTTLKTLITKLNRSCRTAAEQAASLTLSRGHFEVDIEHLLLALLDQPRCRQHPHAGVQRPAAHAA